MAQWPPPYIYATAHIRKPHGPAEVLRPFGAPQFFIFFTAAERAPILFLFFYQR